jgi:hypothetical protein
MLFRLSLLCILFIPFTTFAGPIIRSGDFVSVDSEQELKGDFYAFSPSITISGTAENDAYLAGKEVTVNAPIQGDLSVIAETIQIHGDIGDDARAIGREVVIANNIKGDVVVMGGSLNILSTATVEGDILFMGGELMVEGDVNGSIHGKAETARFNGQIGGDLDMETESAITLGNKAKVLGNVTYMSGEDIVRAQGAEIVGNIQKEETGTQASPFFGVFLLYAGAIFFAVLFLFLLQRRRIEQFIASVTYSPGILGIIGLGIFFIVPFVGFLLMVSIIGMIVGIILLTMYVFLLGLSIMSAGILIGYSLQRVLTKKTSVTMKTILLGTLLFILLGFIPVIGPLLMGAAVLVMLGALSVGFYRLLKP